jgi:septal ring factor EnvC (AmiA/AmiB activator)
MEGLQLFLILFLVVGFAAGAGAVWLVLQGRTSAAYARARSEIQSTLAELSEQLRGKEEQVLALQSTLDQGAPATAAPKPEVEEAATTHTAIDDEKAALAASLQEREQRLAALESELAGARQEVATTRTAIDEEKAALAASLQEREQRLALIESELAGARAEVASQAGPVAPPPLPPPPAAPAGDASVLQILARPIEEHLAEMRVRLEQLSAAPRPEPAVNEETLQNLTRPIEEKIAKLGQRLEEFGAVRPPEPAVTEETLQGLVRPMGEQLAYMSLLLEEIGAARSPEPVVTEETLQGLVRPMGEQLAYMSLRLDELGAAPGHAEILQNLARPIEDQFNGLARRLERLETDQARSSAASAALHSQNAQLKERLHNVTDGLCELRGALARGLDLCSLAVATPETVVEAVVAEAVPAPPPAEAAAVAPEPEPEPVDV